MLGTYRFLLACLVMVSHTQAIGLGWLPLDLGDSAVVGFYFLSGMLMVVVYAEFKRKAERPAISFLYDRAFRLLPSFFLVFGLTLAYYAVWQTQPFPGLPGIVLEAMIFPTAYQPFIETPNVLSVIPVSWALGVEFHFYLVLPLLVALSIRRLRVLFWVFLFGQLAALTQAQYLSETIFGCGAATNIICMNSIADIFGYKMPVFVGVFFIFGVLMQRESHERRMPLMINFFCTYLFAYLFYFSAYGKSLWLKDWYYLSDAVALGALLVVPAAYFIVRDFLDSRHPASSIDQILGKLAYPVFLCHFLAIGIPVGGWLGPGKVFLVTLLLSAAVAVFQAQVDKLRYRIRGFRRTTDVRRADEIAAEAVASSGQQQGRYTGTAG